MKCVPGIVVATTFSIAFATLPLNQASAQPSVEIIWPDVYFDPGRGGGDPDLVLPTPCGGAIAFSKIATPTDVDSPLDDWGIRLGSPRDERAYLEYQRRAFIRGPFPDHEQGTTSFFLGRYEVTRNQYDAVMSVAADADCPEPTTAGRLPVVDVSWFEAIAFTHAYTEWLRREASNALPAIDGKPGFVRLPTEVEWEFAARGGIEVDATTFSASRFFSSDRAVREYAWHEGRDSARGQLKATGRLAPNPLGLFDIYGNAEEMTLDLFHLNKFGRSHGQSGGFVARGGGYLTRPEILGSPTRAEYSFYSSSGAEALALPFLGFRIVITHFVQNSDGAILDIGQDWDQGAAAVDAEDPLTLIDAMRGRETEARRLDELGRLRSMILEDRQARDDAAAYALSRSILLGALVVNETTTARLALQQAEGIKAVRSRDILSLEARVREAEASNSAGLSSLSRQLEEARQRFRDVIAPRVEVVREALGFDEINLLSSLDSVVRSSTAQSAEAEANRVRLELNRSGQGYLIRNVGLFMGLVEAYREKPDMDPAQLRDLVRDATKP